MLEEFTLETIESNIKLMLTNKIPIYSSQHQSLSSCMLRYNFKLININNVQNKRFVGWKAKYPLTQIRSLERFYGTQKIRVGCFSFPYKRRMGRHIGASSFL